MVLSSQLELYIERRIRARDVVPRCPTATGLAPLTVVRCLAVYWDIIMRLPQGLEQPRATPYQIEQCCDNIGAES